MARWPGARRRRIAALADLGITAKADSLPQAEDAPVSIMPKWYVSGGKGRAWIDPQNDVTVKDVKLAQKENFSSVEHLKRYTTLGMATDQGKTGNVLGLAMMAGLTGRTIPETGTTIYRPPYTPVAMGTLAGRSRGKEFKPFRLTPSHKWAEEQGAVFVEVGMWLRTQWLPKPGETHWRQSVDREVLATRKVGGHLRRDHAGQDRHPGHRCRRLPGPGLLPTRSARWPWASAAMA
jgi:hypothetical protein